MRLALTADWLPVFAGAEHVIAELHREWPEAPIFTTLAAQRRLGPLSSADIRVSRLQKWYRIIGNHRVLLPWMPRVVESFDLTGFDVVLSSSHAVGKGIIPPSDAVHVCYCHTPMRYAWAMEREYLEDFHAPQWLKRKAKKILLKMRRWDMTTAKRVDHFIANSRATADRIREVYNRDATVIHPPVQDHFFTVPLTEKRTNFLAVGRLVPYKRFDLLIECANEKKLPLVIVGSGHDEARLRKLAGPTVTLAGFVPESELPSYYARARALLFPQEEDAGIVPLEAQACGTPVIALRRGGAIDTVHDGVSGMFMDEQTKSALSAALDRFATLTFDHAKIREHARQFSSARFREQVRGVVMSEIEERTKAS
jgi:glycosyltransferase involved in cell wall biosynthesis